MRIRRGVQEGHAGLGQAVAQQHFEKAQLHFADFLAVDRGIPAGLEEPEKPAKEEPEDDDKDDDDKDEEESEDEFFSSAAFLNTVEYLEGGSTTTLSRASQCPTSYQ